MKVVTSGSSYIDIDAYAGCIAYAELLNLLGEEAVAASSAPLNESITPTIRKWEVGLARNYTPAKDDTFVLVDISDPEFFDRFVEPSKVVEIIDHHMEFTAMWHRKLGVKSHIEFIGAACTLVYERWAQAEEIPNISETSARLLLAGILDNTLNFEAAVTTERDRRAYDDLKQYAHLPEDWPAQYFEECQKTIMEDLGKAISNDVKIMDFPSLGHKIHVGQLVVWNGKRIIESHLRGLRETMAMIGESWYLSIVSIKESKNYLVTNSEDIQHFLEELLNTHFVDSIATTDRLWLRKEIMKKDLGSSKSA